MNLIALSKLISLKIREKGIVYTIKKGSKVLKSHFKNKHDKIPNPSKLPNKENIHPIMRGAVVRDDNYAIILSLNAYSDCEGLNRNAFLAKGLNRNGYKVAFYYCKNTVMNNPFIYQEDCCIHEPLQNEIMSNFENICKKSEILICSVPLKLAYNYIKIAKSRNLKIVFDYQTDWSSDIGQSIYNRDLVIEIANISDLITAPTYELKCKLQNIIKNDVYILKNGLEVNIFESERNAVLPQYFKKAEKNFCIAGNIDVRSFNWDKAKEIANLYPNYNFCIGGEIPVWIREQNGVMPSNFLYLGIISKEEYSGLLKICDGVIILEKENRNVAIDNTIIAFQAISMKKKVYSTSKNLTHEIPGCIYINENINLINECDIVYEYENDFLIENSIYQRALELINFVKLGKQIRKYPKISVIILNYNNKNVIFRCIDKLIKFNSYNYEIIVVDNNSTDGSYEELLEKYNEKIILVRNNKNGCSCGRNMGAKNATGEYLLFFDSDQWPFTYNWLDSAINILMNNESIGIVGWAGGWLNFNSENIVGGIVDGLFGNQLPCEYGYTTSIDYLGSGGMMLNKDIFNLVGGFDEFYDPTAFEDTDLSYKIKNLGKQVSVCTYMNIFHLGNQTTNSNDSNNTAFHNVFNRNMQYFRGKWQKKCAIEKDKDFKVVFVNRLTMFTQIGGDTIQLLKTKEYLEKNFNLEIYICTSTEEMLLHPDADLFHIFNIQTIDQTEDFVATAKNMNIPIALSPIYWDLSDGIYTYYLSKFGIYCLKPWMSKFKSIVLRCVTPFSNANSWYSKKYIKRNEWILRNVDLLLPNSEEEMDIIREKFKNICIKYKSVPNAIEQKEYDAFKIERKQNRVLVCGRIETVKNQYMLLKALYDYKEIEIVFLGRLNNHKYYEKLKELAESRGNVLFIEEVSNDQVYKYYLTAKVHVLASFRESPGLSTLEAAYFGCNVVFADDKFTPVEYYELEQIGFKCNPYDIESIKEAVIKALKCDIKYDRESYFNRFSYKSAAEETYLAYCDLIDRRIN